MPFEKGNKLGKGRPTKAEELKVQKLGLDAIKDVYGSIEEYYKFIAKESKESFAHLKLLQEYVFGKPKETIETTHNVNDFDIKQLFKIDKDKQ